MKKFYLFLLLVLVGCGDQGASQVASFESADVANKVIVLLAQHQVPATLSTEKENYHIHVEKSDEAKARELLTQFNFYFQREDLNDLLESKFASLSKLETVKSNLLESREIYNKLSVIPNVLRASVVVTGEKSKRISVLIMSLNEFDSTKKGNIERFLKGLAAESDTLTVSYFVQLAGNENA
ncbi:type III secretion protein [Vibrio tetraodonis]|uniref:type III secretion protein n=1 Tax=Vibrio tetraodonis TaxID=2231647 RepID=UPI000E0C8592|nr:type III secretion protein [Vibrio tetraodonis]